LNGVDCPDDRQALVDRGRGQGADRAVVKALGALPGRTGDAPDDVSRAAFCER
jgi:hypothetical protein